MTDDLRATYEPAIRHRTPRYAFLLTVFQLLLAYTSTGHGGFPRDPILHTWMLLAAGFNIAHWPEQMYRRLS